MIATETTPPAITPAATNFARLLGADAPHYVDVVADRLGTFGFCWRGVDRKVSAAGGSRVCGWTIWEMPDTYMTAEFHAVWSDKDGNLLDITPKPDGEHRILFAPDPAYKADFDFYKRPNNRLYPAYDRGGRAAAAAATIDRFSPAQYRYESARASKAGLSLLEHNVARSKPNPRHRMIDEFIAVIEELHSLTIILPEGTVLPPSQRARNLACRQSALKAALGI